MKVDWPCNEICWKTANGQLSFCTVKRVIFVVYMTTCSWLHQPSNADSVSYYLLEVDVSVFYEYCRPVCSHKPSGEYSTTSWSHHPQSLSTC